MGHWGPGLFDNDLALDIRATFEAALATGLDVATATQQVFEDFAEAAEDDDERPVLYLALAALQLEQGYLQPEMRGTAVELILTGQAMMGWEDTDGQTRLERQQVLDKLKEDLTSVA